MPTRARLRWPGGAAAALLVVGGLACGRTEQAGRRTGPSPVVVEAVTVAAESLRDVVSFTGQLDAEESVMLRPETSGIIEEFGFEEGQEVRHGTVLFRLRDHEQRARVAAAEASLVLAQRNHARAVSLRKDGVLSVEEHDRSFAELELARAALDVAKVALDRTVIRAPFDGVVGRRFVSPGDHVRGGGGTGADGTGLLQVDAVATLQLVFSVPERAVQLMRVGLPIEVGVTPFPGERFGGAIDFVAPTIDPRNRRLFVKARIPNEDRRLRPGLSATVHLELGNRAAALVIPESALVYDAGGSFVWRISDDDTAVRVAVEIGTRQDGHAEITAGLAPGDRIVSAGTNKIAPGRAVRVAEPVTAEAVPATRADS